MTTESTASTAAELPWFKSSYSSNDEPACVEVAACPDTIHVRDSKDPEGPALAFAPAAWSAFLAYAADQQV
ncbi:DUF397 domain-containing protein [Streptomyces sp. NPDC021020]|uniref:DUF397 domain-containing protein n=1 Tax=Streptomyces sp. NPDC021020 TaxID=3365109 RepID=UPI0037B54C90